MTYVKLDDGFHAHPKIVGLSDSAYRLYVGMLCYASSHETDGFIPVMTVPILVPGRNARKLTQELASAGLVDQGDTRGWLIHDYLDHQRSKAQIDAQREATRNRLKRYRNGVSNADSNVNETALVTPGETLLQRGRGTERHRGREAEDVVARARAVTASEWFEYVTDRPPRGRALVQQLADLDAAHGPDCIAWAFEQSIGKDDPPTYARRILGHCIIEGHGPRSKRDTTAPEPDEGEEDDAGARAARALLRMQQRGNQDE